jgi:hypothetical protein
MNHEAHEDHEGFLVVLDVAYGGLQVLRFGCAGRKDYF